MGRAAAWAQKNRERSREIKARSAAAHRQEQAAWRAANHVLISAKKRAACQANREQIRARQAAYYAATREARAVKRREYAAQHRAEQKIRARAHYEANRLSYIQRARDYYDENRDQVRERYRAQPDVARANNQRRRAVQADAICAHGQHCVTAAFLSEIRQAICAYCGDPAAHADHFVPLARGGTHCRNNLVPACQPCNQSKSSRDPEEWLRNGRLLA